LASVSKQFTALAILILEQKGMLKLSDTLQQFFPELPYSNISIENLLNHSSGLPDYETLLKKVWDKSQFAYNSDVVKLLAIHQPKALFPSGEQFEYCNTGYVLLSSIIEKVSKQSYQQFLEQHIFEPLQMKHTRVYNTRRTAKEKIENYAYGYVYSGYKNEYVLVDSLAQYNYVIYQDGITGDGTVNSCIKDLQIWEREIINPQVINPLLFEKAFQNRTLKNGTPTNYGYGFFISGEEKLSYHTGGWPGYTSMVMNFLDQQKQIIILSNNYYTHFTRMADEMAEALLK
jgi:CubicO group peptidase (beta-lactamase class C family)